jgi:hypothetical protein
MARSFLRIIFIPFPELPGLAAVGGEEAYVAPRAVHEPDLARPAGHILPQPDLFGAFDHQDLNAGFCQVFHPPELLGIAGTDENRRGETLYA